MFSQPQLGSGQLWQQPTGTTHLLQTSGSSQGHSRLANISHGSFPGLSIINLLIINFSTGKFTEAMREGGWSNYCYYCNYLLTYYLFWLQTGSYKQDHNLWSWTRLLVGLDLKFLRSHWTLYRTYSSSSAIHTLLQTSWHSRPPSLWAERNYEVKDVSSAFGSQRVCSYFPFSLQLSHL